MKITAISFIPLQIPFVSEFSHALHKRAASDTFLIKISTDSNIIGYGEALVRPYLTGETIDDIYTIMKDHMVEQLACVSWNFDDNINEPMQALASVAEQLDRIISVFQKKVGNHVIALNGLRCALELAIVDALLQEQNISLATMLAPHKQQVQYSAIISAGTHEKSTKIARHFKQLGFEHYKLKVLSLDDLNIVRDVREIIGVQASLRLDANAGLTVEQTKQLMQQCQAYNIEAIEQPIARGDVNDFKAIQSSTDIAIIPDESLISYEDALSFAELKATKLFNIRLAKCGGIYNCLRIAQLAKQNNIAIQLGCLVGETAILSAVGRHLSAHLEQCRYTEGSYGTLLLQQDIAKQSIRFGYAGIAPLLKGVSYGITVDESIINKYCITEQVLELTCSAG